MKDTVFLKNLFDSALDNHKKKNFNEAEKLYKEIIKKKPNDLKSNFYLGTLYLQNKNYIEAKNILTISVKLQPEHANSYLNLGCAYAELGQYEKAVENLNKSLELDPKNENSYFNLGNTYRNLSQHNKAINFYIKTIEINPKNSRAFHSLGDNYLQLGKIEKSINSFEKAYNLNPLINLAALNRLIKINEKKYLTNFKKKEITEIIKNDKINTQNLAYAYFILSKFELKDKNYKKELDYLIKGHANYYEFKKKSFRDGVDYWLTKIPNLTYLKNINKSKNNNELINIKPIFIVGIPRTGSTLIERIIVSGKNKLPLGEESGIISSLIGDKILKKKLQETNINHLKEEIVKKYYLKSLINKKNNYRFTDKTLENFFFIELIYQMFPGAKIINCNRNPISTILSIIKNNLTEVPWAHNVENILKYYDNYLKIINYYKNKFPKLIYDFDYDELLNNPEQISKNVYKYCDLEWDKVCLDFYKRKDLIASTASNLQIRKSIYKHKKVNSFYINFFEKYKNKYNWLI